MAAAAHSSATASSSSTGRNDSSSEEMLASLCLSSPKFAAYLRDRRCPVPESLVLANLSVLRSFLRRPEEDSRQVLEHVPSLVTSKTSDLYAKLLLLRALPLPVLSIGAVISLPFHRCLLPNLLLLSSVPSLAPAALLPALARQPTILSRAHCSHVLPNLLSLPDTSSAPALLRVSPRPLFLPPDHFRALLDQLREIGGYDLAAAPVLVARALRVLAGMSLAKWKSKVAMLLGLGWSEGDVLGAFRRRPEILLKSEEKLRARAEFFAGCLRWTPSAIAERPAVLTLSLEKRVIPRCSVFNLLASKGAISRKMPEYKIFTISNERFLNTYVTRHQDKIPEVLDAWNGKLQMTALEMECHVKPNIQTLRNYGVPEASIKKLVRRRSRGLATSPAHIKAIMKGLKRMEFDFSSKAFLDALDVLGTMPNIISQGKFVFYIGLGWSDTHIFTALKKQPYYVMVPDNEVRKTVEFLKRELNWGPEEISNSPGLLLVGLESVIIPRYSLFKVLVAERCLRRKSVPGPSFFLMEEERFYRLYVRKYAESHPSVSEIYSRSA